MNTLTLAEIDAVDETMNFEPVPACRVAPLPTDVAIANLQAAKAGWRNMHYKAEDDVPTLEQATDDVLHYYCCTPGTLSQWLDDHCHKHNEVIPAHRLPDALGSLTVPQLLVLLFTGPAWVMNSTALQLRKKFMDDTREIAAELAPDEIAIQRKALGLS